MKKRRNRVCRRIAVALAVALLVGQSHAFVLAEEGAGDVPQTEISFGETGTDNSSGNVDSQPSGDQQDGEDGQDKCVCGTKCEEDAVNTDCPVCAADSAACAGKADDKGNGGPGNSNTGDNDTENGGQDNIDGSLGENTDEPKRCVCETACTEGAVNADCPVCAADYANCAQNAEGGVNPAEGEVLTAALAAELSEDEGIDAQADEGMEALALADFQVGDIWYGEVSWDEVQVQKPDDKNIERVEIPAEVTNPANKVTYPVKRVGLRAFANCKALNSITFPSSITMINEGAFNGCSGLTSIEIPDQVTEIERDVFGNCSELKTVKLPSGLKRLGPHAFTSCKELVDVELPEGLEYIDAAAFSQCTNLGQGNGGTIIIPDSVKSMEMSVFWGCTSLTNFTFPNSFKSVPSYVFRDCTNLQKVDIPVGVWRIETSAFQGCTSLGQDSDGTVYIPDSVTEVQQSAFKECKALERITIPDQVTKISDNTFESCDNLREVILPDGLTAIGVAAFMGCGSLSSIKLPKSVINLQNAAFKQCTSLNRLEIVIPSGQELETINVGLEVFADLPGDRSLIFLKEDGSALTGEDLKQVQLAYLKAGESDDDPDDGKWYGWSVGELAEPADTYTIVASVTEGGSISPSGSVSVNEGDDKTFTITPNEGNRIKSVTVDDEDVTADLKDTRARAQAGARYYTFTDVNQNHTIHAEFERDGGDNPKPDDGGNTNPGGGSGDGGNSGGGNSAGDGQPAAGAEIVSMQVGSDASVGSSAASDSGKAAGATAGSAVSGAVSSASGQAAGASGTAANGREPKTGDASYMEVYATLAMVAGLTYLLLYVMEESRGMSEREKDAFVAAFIRWGKKGGAFRKCCAMAAIFCLLMYYHIIGKRAGGNALRGKYLGQIS